MHIGRNQGGTSLTVSKTTKPSSAHNPSTRGNVHTGATPPWLREDDSDDGDSNSASGHVSSIGPSVEEFIKHSTLLVSALFVESFYMYVPRISFSFTKIIYGSYSVFHHEILFLLRTYACVSDRCCNVMIYGFFRST